MKKFFKIALIAFSLVLVANSDSSFALENDSLSEAVDQGSGIAVDGTPQEIAPPVVKSGASKQTIFGLMGLAQALIGNDFGGICAYLKIGDANGDQTTSAPNNLEKFWNDNCEKILFCGVGLISKDDNRSDCGIRDCFLSFKEAVNFKKNPTNSAQCSSVCANPSSPDCQACVSENSKVSKLVLDTLTSCSELCSVIASTPKAQKICGVTSCIGNIIDGVKSCNAACSTPGSDACVSCMTGTASGCAPDCTNPNSDNCKSCLSAIKVIPPQCCNVISGRFGGNVGGFISQQCTNVFNPLECKNRFTSQKSMDGECCANLDRVTGLMNSNEAELADSFCSQATQIMECREELKVNGNTNPGDSCCAVIASSMFDPKIKQFVPDLPEPYDQFDDICVNGVNTTLPTKTCAGSTGASDMTAACCKAYSDGAYIPDGVSGPTVSEITAYCNVIKDDKDSCMVLANSVDASGNLNPTPTCGSGSLDPRCNDPAYCTTNPNSAYCNSTNNKIQLDACCSKMGDFVNAGYSEAELKKLSDYCSAPDACTLALKSNNIVQSCCTKLTNNTLVIPPESNKTLTDVQAFCAKPDDFVCRIRTEDTVTATDESWTFTDINNGNTVSTVCYQGHGPGQYGNVTLSGWDYTCNIYCEGSNPSPNINCTWTNNGTPRPPVQQCSGCTIVPHSNGLQKTCQ